MRKSLLGLRIVGCRYEAKSTDSHFHRFRINLSHASQICLNRRFSLGDVLIVRRLREHRGRSELAGSHTGLSTIIRPEVDRRFEYVTLRLTNTSRTARPT
jgi:hypothetical protein